MLNLQLLTWATFLVWLVVGLVLYAAYGRRHSRLAPPGDLAPLTGPASPAPQERVPDAPTPV
ncbi:amino acid permease C-terminal domain-containing protein [Streptomyces sp. NPDC058000]|uniref:amino acid permease C-terminal domain-containing protein n=1 Tax=Streptomyces sp. NPDC058000 TaxID=3346299 RepID=UPI0036EA9C74